MTSGSFRFDRFRLDPGERQLRRDEVPVEINARYLDALALLVRNPGGLVPKDRFMSEVWRGVPVTDEALTQCIRTLRRLLGDDAAAPRFIETVPKHGYRFIAAVEPVGPRPAKLVERPPRLDSRRLVRIGAAGTIGAGFAGLSGGLLYALAGASPPLEPGMGAGSVLLVLVCLSILAALTGGAGVSFGIAAAGLARSPAWQWSVAGGAVGGLLVGAFGKLLGLDAFNLLLGRSPGDITGGGEGALLGAAVGLSAWIAGRRPAAPGPGVAAAAALGGAAGLVIALLGGRLMGGSLALLARQFPDSRLRFDPIGALFGEAGFGPTSALVASALEGALFAACIVFAMHLARRHTAGSAG